MACFGGDTVYAALAASFWSDHVRLVTPIGNDFPGAHLKKLQLSGWDLSGMPQRDIPTTRNWIVYEYDGMRTWIIRSDPDDFYELSPIPADVPPAYQNARAFLILAMDLTAQMELTPYLKSLGAVIALDPQEDYIVGNQDQIFNMLSQVDIFLPSQEEVHRLLGHRDYMRAGREFAEYGSGTVIIKMGEEGALIYDNAADKFWNIPVYPTAAQDTTGAGDSFSGGFMAMYIRSGDLWKSGLAGAVSASFAIEGFGATHVFDVTRQSAHQRLQEMLSQ